MEIDHIDYHILQLLSEDARIQWKDLGNQIHMTGQAVGNRIKKLEDNGVIHSYSLVVDELKLGFSFTAFVIIYMKTANHQEFIHFVQEQNEVREVHRVSGEGCYHLKIKLKSQDQLNIFLNDLLQYGNYSIHLSIQEIKQQTAFKSV